VIEIEAMLIYTNVRAILRTFNPRQTRYYQQDGKFRVGVCFFLVCEDFQSNSCLGTKTTHKSSEKSIETSC